MQAETRLAAYGTLAPGQVNNRELDGLRGRWLRGTVRGTLIAKGWGAAHGCPGLILDPDAGAVEVLVFESEDLPRHWARLDAFDGPSYRRTATEVLTESGPLAAFIYEIDGATKG